MSLFNGLDNATLTLVTGVGSSADYDRDPVAGPTKFSGEERVFWKEDAARVTNGSSSDILIERSMLVNPDIAVTWAQGDTVTVSRDEEGVRSARVMKFTTSGTHETGRVTRVIFEDA